MESSGRAVIIPLLNANEPEAKIADLAVEEGQHIRSDQVICTLETTKATQELLAESEGYVRGLRVIAEQTVTVGEILCYIASDPNWEPPLQTLPEAGEGPAPPENIRITKPALQLAHEHNLDLSALPQDTLITESAVRKLLSTSTALPAIEGAPAPLDANRIVVYGAGGHGKSVIDLIRSRSIYTVAGVIDDNLPPGQAVLDVETLGGSQALAKLHHEGVRQAANAVGGIGNIQVRIRIFDLLKAAGFHSPMLTHPRAVIEASAKVAAGVQVFPLAYIGTDCRVGFGTIVNTGAIVSHDCSLADFVNISPGAILAGGVEVGEGALIGMGVTVNLEVRVGAKARIGNGATVKADVPDNGLVPAGTIWPK